MGQLLLSAVASCLCQKSKARLGKRHGYKPSVVLGTCMGYGMAVGEFESVYKGAPKRGLGEGGGPRVVGHRQRKKSRHRRAQSAFHSSRTHSTTPHHTHATGTGMPPDDVFVEALVAATQPVLLLSSIHALSCLSSASPSSPSSKSSTATLVGMSTSTFLLLGLLAWSDPLVATMLGVMALCVARSTYNVALAAAVLPSLLLVILSPERRAVVAYPEPMTMGPDMGIWWYLMTEVFRQFQPYFRLIFAAHPFLYLPPLAFRVLAGSATSDQQPLPEPLLRLLYLVVASISMLFHPSPIMIQQLSLAIALVVWHPDLLTALRPKLLVLSVGVGVPILLAPIMKYLWLDARSGNANYLYFQTLVWTVFHSLLVLEVTVVLVQHATKRRKEGDDEVTKRISGRATKKQAM